jgi:hypothetical protein
MVAGWVKLHRSAEDHPVLKNATRRGLFDRMLLRAARQPRRVSWRGRSIALERGQLAVSVREFAEANELGHKETRLHLDRLAREGMISVTPILATAKDTEKGTARANLGTLITIRNFDKFQLSTDEEADARGTAWGAVPGTARAQQGHTEQEVGETKNLETETLLATTEPPTCARTREEPAPAGPVVATSSLLLIGSKEGCSEAGADRRWRRIVTAAEGDERLAGVAVDIAYHEAPLGVPLTKYAIGVCRRQIIQERAQIKAALDMQSSVPSEMERQYQASMQVLYDAGYIPPERRH